MPFLSEAEAEPDYPIGGGTIQPIDPAPTPMPINPTVGMSDPAPTPIVPSTEAIDPGALIDPFTPPPSALPTLDENGNPVSILPATETTNDLISDPAGTTVQDLYPEGGTGEGGGIGDVVGAEDTVVADPTGAAVTETDAGVTEFDTAAADSATDRIGGLLDQGGGGIDAATTALTDEQRVDAELARILGEDSLLMQQARADAARQANARGLQNTSMAAGMAQDAMVRAAMPMAQQNAAQAAARELANTENRQEAGMFTASEQNRLSAIEAELGQSLNVFNSEQLNQAEKIMAQMRTALEQQDAAAYNNAAQQLADLQRDAQAQQSDIDFQMSQAEADAINNRNAQIIDSVTRLNAQFLQNQGGADIATIQGTYQQLIATNQAAASIYNAGLSAMGALMDNPDMTPQQVASGLSAIQNTIEASLRMLSNINDMDFGDLVAGAGGGGATTPFGDGGGGDGGGGTPGDEPLPEQV